MHTSLMEALYEVTGHDVDDIDYLIENVAMATIGDVMDLEMKTGSLCVKVLKC